MKIARYTALCAIIFSLVIAPRVLAAEKIITFNGKTFGGEDYEEGNYVIETDDGGYLALGSTRSFGAGDVDLYLVKTDEKGEEQWSKTFGGKDYDAGNALAKTDDGGYLILGTTKSFGEGKSDIYLVKIDNSGNEKWKKTFGTKEVESANSIEKTKDGGFIIFGTSLIKLDKAGELEWEMTYAETGIDLGYSVHQTDDGGYILLGAGKMSRLGKRKLNMSKVNPEGNLEGGWPKSLIMASADQGSTAIQLSDGDYLVAGGSAALTLGKKDVYIEKIDKKRQKLWSKTFGGNKYDRGNSIQEVSDGGFIIVGNTQSFGEGKADVYVIRTTAVGKIIWEKTFGGRNFDRGNFVRETSDGGFIIIGSTHSFGAGKSNMYLIKIDKDGNAE